MKKQTKNYKKIFKNHVNFDWDTEKYQIHHVNGNHEDNRINNLVLLPTNMHITFHSLYSELIFYKDMFEMDNNYQEYVDWERIEKYLYLKSSIFNLERARAISSLQDDPAFYIKRLHEEEVLYAQKYDKEI